MPNYGRRGAELKNVAQWLDGRVDARGQLGCDPWSAEGPCKFQTSFRPMYHQGLNFQHIIEKGRKQGKGIEEEGQRKNQETTGNLEVPPLGRSNLQKTLENLKFQLLTTFSLIYSQMNCLGDRCLNVLIISQIQGLTGPPNGCFETSLKMFETSLKPLGSIRKQQLLGEHCKWRSQGEKGVFTSESEGQR